MKHEDEQRNEQELSETQQAATEADAIEEPEGETAENVEVEAEADASAEVESDDGADAEPEALEAQDADESELMAQTQDDAGVVEIDEAETPAKDAEEVDGEAEDAAADAEDSEAELEAADAEDSEAKLEAADDEEPAESEATDEAENEAADEPQEDATSDDESQEDSEAEASDDEDREHPEDSDEPEADGASAEADAEKPDDGTEETDAAGEGDLLAPPELPSDEPIVYGLDDDADGKGARKATVPRKFVWLAIGGLAAAALCAGLAMNAGNQDVADNTSTQTIEVEVASSEEDLDKPLRLTESSVAEMLSTLNFERSDVALTGDLVMIEASGGHLVVVQVLDENTGVSPWALIDLTVERGAALANQLTNRTYQGEDDNRPFEITELTWNVIDLDDESYMAVSFPPGFTEESGSTAALLKASGGYTISDGIYYALGGESVGYPQSGGTAPTNAWDEPIITSAYLSSYGNGMPAEESQQN